MSAKHAAPLRPEDAEGEEAWTGPLALVARRREASFVVVHGSSPERGAWVVFDDGSYGCWEPAGRIAPELLLGEDGGRAAERS